MKDALAGSATPLTPESPVVFRKRTVRGACTPFTAGGVICSRIRYVFLLPWGAWQSRQPTDQVPYLRLVVWEEWVRRLWQSVQSWSELSRTRRLPSPEPAALTTTFTGRDWTAPSTVRA